ncbi:MAG: hypothetical protein ACRDJE_23485, partial [Dehalococcoidia bacterium]
MTNSTRSDERVSLFVCDTKENQQDYFLIPSEVLDRCRITPEEALTVARSAPGAALGDDAQGHLGFLGSVAAGLVAAYIYDNHVRQVNILEGIR